MCRSPAEDRLAVHHLVLVALLAWAPMWATPVRADGPTAEYLESLGLTDLLIVHLESRIESVTSDARPALLRRLGALYAAQLDAASSAEEREDRLGRARAVLQRIGGRGSEAIELSIARAAYRGAEQVAEARRVRASDPDAVAAARSALGSIARDLADLDRRVDRIIETSRQQLARAEGSRAMDLSESFDEGLKLRGEIAYLHAWTDTYRAWLQADAGERALDLDDAEERFESLLDLGEAGAIPDAVSVGRCEVEGYARAVLGMAACRSIAGSMREAESWLDVLEAPQVHASVRRQLPGWRLAVLVDGGAWRRVRDQLEVTADDASAPSGWFRMVAARGMEVADDRMAEVAVRAAVDVLAERGELDTLYDLAERYGVAALGDRGFVVRFVLAAQAFEQAAAAHGRRRGTSGAARQAWRGVAERLGSALDASDAEDRATTRADAERLLGWAHWYAGDPASARDWFARAAEDLLPEAAAEAMWMAIVSTDELVAGGRDDLRADAEALADEFLRRFPGNTNAPALRARRIAGDVESAAEADIDALLAVPRRHEQWRAARETVAAVFVRRFRQGGAGAADAGRRYLAVALELLDGEDAAPVGRDASRTVDTARLALEIALSPDVDGLEDAEAVLARLDRWRTQGWSSRDHDAELAFRRTQWLLAVDRWSEAAERVSTALTEDPDAALRSSWWMASIDRVLRAAGGRRARGIAPERLGMARSIAEPVIGTMTPRAARAGDALRVFVSAVDVAFEVWRQDRDRDAAGVVLDAMERMRAAMPTERSILARSGRLATELGSDAIALECWRTISDGLDPPEQLWYEARWGVATVLAKSNAPRALRVLRQHVAFEPDYGPDPWGPRLRALHQRLETEAASSGEDDPEADGAEANDADADGTGANDTDPNDTDADDAGADDTEADDAGADGRAEPLADALGRRPESRRASTHEAEVPRG